MPLYRKKGVVEAVQWNGHAPDLPEWARDAATGYASDGNILVETGQGLQEGKPGDWIVKSPTGAVYPCPAADFALSYEPAGAE